MNKTCKDNRENRKYRDLGTKERKETPESETSIPGNTVSQAE